MASDEVGSHPAVIGELALGSLANRGEFLTLLASLRQFPPVSHEELMAFIAAHKLWGRALSLVDVQLLTSVLIVPGSTLRTHDRRLNAVATEFGIAALVI